MTCEARLFNTLSAAALRVQGGSHDCEGRVQLLQQVRHQHWQHIWALELCMQSRVRREWGRSGVQGAWVWGWHQGTPNCVSLVLKVVYNMLTSVVSSGGIPRHIGMHDTWKYLHTTPTELLAFTCV